MKVIVCPDSFKGSLSAAEAAAAIARGIKKRTGKALVAEIPLADGGEGTMDALLRAKNGKIRRALVRDPLMREIKACYGILGDGKTAVVEMAAASGLNLLSESERNPMAASTYGTGELLAAALAAGAKRIIVAAGGSATNDGGAGAMTALGIRFLNLNGRELPPGGAALADLARVDTSRFRFPVRNVRVEVACDVMNPLCGPRGASYVFGPQKGANPQMVKQLDAALANYARVLKRELGKDVAELPGAGAAGGLAAGLAAFLDAQLRSGIDIVLDAVRFDEILDGTDLVVTGEGRLDEQTPSGKTIAGVVRRAAARHIPVIALAGSVSGELTSLYSSGLTAAYSIVGRDTSVEYAMENASKLLEALAEAVISDELRILPLEDR